MACQGLRVILDTSVFIFWYHRNDNHSEIMKSIREEGLKMVLCEDLQEEYLRNLYKRSVSNYWLLQRELQILSDENILEYVNPNPDNPITIHEDDQHVLNCALTKDCDVHMIVTDNTPHFKSNTPNYKLPVIISSQDFQNSNSCHTYCSEAKRICQRIREVGENARYN